MKTRTRTLLAIVIAFLMVQINPLSVVHGAGDNIALYKPAFSSGEYTEQYPASNVTDGTTNFVWAQGGLNAEQSAFWDNYIAVDLLDRYVLDTIIAYNRGDQTSVTDQQWILQVANQRDFSDAVTVGERQVTGAAGEGWTVNLELEEGYRYVRVTFPGHFVVGEIEVFGVIYDPNSVTKGAMEDIAGTAFEAPATLTDAVGLLTRASSYEFSPYDLITRMQALKLVLDLIHVSPTGQTIDSFSDVPVSSPDNVYLATGVLAGFISKDTAFRPNDYVTVKEISKMLLYALGYSPMVEAKGGYLTGINILSDEIKLQRGIAMEDDDVVNRGTAAIILYNALKAYPLRIVSYRNDGTSAGLIDMQTNESTLKYYYGLDLKEGIVTADKATSLVEQSGKSATEFQIDNVNYASEDGLVNQYLGMRVEFAVDENDSIAYICPVKNTILTIDAEDINEASRQQIETLVDNSKSRYDIDQKVSVIKNGVVYPAWTQEDFEPNYGSLVLIDNNRDDVFDVVLIKEPIAAVVKNVNYSEDFVIEAQNLDAPIRVTRPEPLRVTKNGRSYMYSRIREDDVALVYIPESGSSLQIDVITNSISAQAEEVSTDSVVISGVEYKFSTWYQQNYGTNDVQSFLGTIRTYYLDDKDRVVYVSDNNLLKEDAVLAFIQKVDIGKGIDSQIQLRVFTQAGIFETYGIADVVEIDGLSCNSSNIVKEFGDPNVYFKEKFAAIVVNSQKQITWMDTENYYADRESDSRMIRDTSISATPGVDVYIPGANGFFEHSLPKYSLKRNAVTFVIPMQASTATEKEPTGIILTGETYDTLYSVSTAETVFGTLDQMQPDEDLALFGTDEIGFPLFAVSYAPTSVSTSTAGGSFTYISKYDAPGLVLEKVTSSVDSEGAQTYKLYGYDLQNGMETSVILDAEITRMYNSYLIQMEHQDWLYSPSHIRTLNPDAIDETDPNFSDYVVNVSDLRCGDVIRYELREGVAYAAERVFARKDVNREFYLPSSGEGVGVFYSTASSYGVFPSAQFRLAFGTVEKIQDDTVQLTLPPLQGETSGKNMPFTIGGARLMVVHDNKIEVTNGINLGSYLEDTSKLLLYTSGGTSYAIVIYS